MFRKLIASLILTSFAVLPAASAVEPVKIHSSSAPTTHKVTKVSKVKKVKHSGKHHKHSHKHSKHVK